MTSISADEFCAQIVECDDFDALCGVGHDSTSRQNSEFTIDFEIDGGPCPLFVFGIADDKRASAVTAYLLRAEAAGIRTHSICIFKEFEQMDAKVLAKLTDVGDKCFSSFADNRARLIAYVRDFTVGK